MDELDPDLEAVLGLYETHRFCIRLSADTSLLDERGALRSLPEIKTIATFAHEYCHFLHNVSTVWGWTAYELFQNLIALFSHSLTDNGDCDPSRLRAEQLDEIRSCCSAIDLLQGGGRISSHPSPPSRLRFQKLQADHAQNQGIDVPVVSAVWTIDRRDGSSGMTSSPIGAHLIEEGVAYLLEGFVRMHKVCFGDAADHTGTPLFPYLAFQYLCRALAPSLTPLAAVRIGTLALCTNRPGPYLVCALSAYEQLRAHGRNDQDATEEIKAAAEPAIHFFLNRISKENAAALPTIFAGRGLLEDGATVIAALFPKLLIQRQANLWFDLEWCSASDVPDLTVLRGLHHNVLPCDIIQERPGPDAEFKRDVLLTFRDAKTVAGVRALQAQYSFLKTHLPRLLGAAGTDDPKCPFYTSCPLSWRESDAYLCAARPWARVKLQATCWYGSAVAGTLGTVTRDSTIAARTEDLLNQDPPKVLS